MVWPPPASVLVVSAAVLWPGLDGARGDVPSVVLVVVSVKVTEPACASVLGALALTVAVNVTGSPKTVGLLLVLTVVAVVPWLIVWGTMVELLEAKLPVVSLNMASMS